MDERSRNYATALYELCDAENRQETLRAFTALMEDLEKEPELKRMLSSYNLTLQEKRDLIDGIYGKKHPELPHFVSFIKVVCDHHRTASLPAIYSCYRTLVYGDLGVKEGYAYSAERLTKKQLSDIETAIGRKIGSQVSLTNIVDHKLLGGVKVAVDGKTFDGTLASALQGLRRELKGGTPQ